MASPLLFSSFFASFIFSASCQVLDPSNLPQVDLGYCVVQAIENGSDFYSFYNIRYAEPPLGELRFATPIPPQTVNRTVNDGSQSVICPQARPDWLSQALGSDPMGDSRVSEDCLCLDVVVPRSGFSAREETGLMPVLVWIHGGGYTEGDKSAMVSGLLSEASKSTKHIPGVKEDLGTIFVAMNYRLGLFGWLSGPTFQSNGTANAGLYDQRLALQWVQEYIPLFGGDPNRVTVIGESAGGGCIMHQITALGGIDPHPFQQAIIQSPGFIPTPSNDQQENIFQETLSLANCSNIEEARSLSTEELQAVNQQMVGGAPYGGSVFSPVVDGTFVPGLPGKLLHQGAYDSNLSLLIGHNSNEGALFVNPNTSTNADFYGVVRDFFPRAPTPVFNYIIQELYPAIFDDTTGQYPYTNNYERTCLLVSEAIFTCNTNYLARAFKNQTYNYIFSVSPGLHGQDIPYTFFVPNTTETDSITGTLVDSAIALELQDYITSFAATGNPNVGSFGETEGPSPQFVMYGAGGRARTLSDDGIGMTTDPAFNERCLWWQEALYY